MVFKVFSFIMRRYLRECKHSRATTILLATAKTVNTRTAVIMPSQPSTTKLVRHNYKIAASSILLTIAVRTIISTIDSSAT